MKGLLPLILVGWSWAAPTVAEVSIRPMPRPVQAAPEAAQIAAVEGGALVRRSIRPMARPDTVAVASPAPKKGLIGTLFGGKKSDAPAPKRQSSGAICQDAAIQGTAIPTIRGEQAGCGIENPVRVTAVNGVRLSMPATIDCETARALRSWVSDELQPAFRRDKVVGLEVAAHYVCRGRNNQKGAKISEHGRGRAIDIAGFRLASGATLSVLDDYKSRRGKPMRAAHKGACGVFGTTLGPGSDGYHEDHLHFDTARYRGGPYCK